MTAHFAPTVRRDVAYDCCAAQGTEPLRRRLANSDARVGYRISVCSSGAASICQRASTSVGHTIVLEDSPPGPCPQRYATGMSPLVYSPLRSEVEAVMLDQLAGYGSTSFPIAHKKAAISLAIATVATVWRLPLAMSLR